jgi:hypothetical protein
MSAAFQAVFHVFDLELQKTDLLRHAVIASVLLAKENSQKQAQKNEHPQQTEKNEIAGELET